MRKLHRDTDQSRTNFEQVFKEWNDFTVRHFTPLHVDKAVCFKAFEHLMELELVMPIENTHNSMKEYLAVRLMVYPEQVDTTLKEYENLPIPMQKWGLKWIE